MRLLLDLLVPPVCDGCGRPGPPPWCAECDGQAAAVRVTDPCARCAASRGPGHPCWSDDAPIGGTVALTAWRDPVATALLRAKLVGRGEVFAALGPRIAAAHGVLDRPRLAAVVPVPTDPRRVRQRGADHTRVLARTTGRALRRPAIPALRVGRRMPDRGSAVVEHRAAVPHDAFVATSAAGSLRGRTVLLVDDVLTTGGTAAAAARTLLVAGVAAVHLGVVARAGSHPLEP